MRKQQTNRRRTWVVVGLLIYCGIVGLVLLLPVRYASIVNTIGDWMRYDLGLTWFGSGWIEFTANILMFVPLGFLLTLLFSHPWYGVILALGLSAAAEVAQIVIPSRHASLRDILANVAGAALGAALAWLIVLRRSRAQQRKHSAVAEDARQP